MTRELVENEGTIEEVKEKSQESSPHNSDGLRTPKNKKNNQVKFGDPSHTKSSNTLSGTSEDSSIFSNNNERGNGQRREFVRRKSQAQESVSRMYTHSLDEIGKGSSGLIPLPKIPEGTSDVTEIIKEKEKETKRQSEQILKLLKDSMKRRISNRMQAPFAIPIAKQESGRDSPTREEIKEMKANPKFLSLTMGGLPP